ncbi:MAG: hypothetical protein U9Q66_02855, partial [Patescibacteria group bacterium]|nr:hypothetical protein [Patescibacteria group bacterium]
NIKFSSNFKGLDIYIDNSYSQKLNYSTGTVMVPYLKKDSKIKVIVVKNNNFDIVHASLPKDAISVLSINDHVVFNIKKHMAVFLFLTSDTLEVIEPKFVELDNGKGVSLIDNTTLVYKDVVIDNLEFSNLYKNIFYKFNIDNGSINDTNTFANADKLSDKILALTVKNRPDLEYIFDYSTLNFINKSDFVATVEKNKAYKDVIKDKNKKGNQDSTSFIVILFQVGLLFILLYLAYYATKKMYKSFKEYRVEQISAVWKNMSKAIGSPKLTDLMLEAYDLKHHNVSNVLKKAIVDFEENITELALVIHKYKESLVNITDETNDINDNINEISHALVDNKTGSADRIAALKKKLDIYNESLDELSSKKDSISDKLENVLLVKVSELIAAFESIIADAKLSKLERELDKNVNDFNDKMNDISNSLETDSLMKDVDYALSIERFKNELEQKLKKVIGE